MPSEAPSAPAGSSAGSSPASCAGSASSSSIVAVGTKNVVPVSGVEKSSMPFGRPGAGEFGTYFIGYAGRVWVIEQMLKRTERDNGATTLCASPGHALPCFLGHRPHIRTGGEGPRAPATKARAHDRASAPARPSAGGLG